MLARCSGNAVHQQAVVRASLILSFACSMLSRQYAAYNQAVVLRERDLMTVQMGSTNKLVLVCRSKCQADCRTISTGAAVCKAAAAGKCDGSMKTPHLALLTKAATAPDAGIIAACLAGAVHISDA